MPNWCYNRLRITATHGKEQELVEFIEKAKGEQTELALSNFVPTPPPLLDQPSPCHDPEQAKANEAQYGAPDWYDWRIKHWGVDWDIEAELLDKEHGVFEFHSAWAPPTAWLKAVSGLYPNLIFILRYFDDGMGFMGLLISSNGALNILHLDYLDTGPSGLGVSQARQISVALRKPLEEFIEDLLDIAQRLYDEECS